MRAYCAKTPRGRLEMKTISHSPSLAKYEGCKYFTSFDYRYDQVKSYWEYLEAKGYGVVPVEVTEVEK